MSWTETSDATEFAARVREAQLCADHDGRLIIWVIYEKPLDHLAHWVVRGQEPGPGGQIILHQFCFCARTLTEARAAVPCGLVRMARHPKDDPCIVEVWI
jgi:hypothetical protein